MTFGFKLALSYLRTPRRSLVSFTSVVAIIGIAAGVASLIIAQALANGFREEIRDKVLSNTAHISVTQAGTSRISNWQYVKQKIEEIEGITAVEPMRYESALIAGESATSYAVLRIRDEGAASRQSTNERSKPSNGDDEKARIAVGKQLAEKLKLKVGDNAELTFAGKKDTPITGSARIDRIFETGFHQYDATWVFLSESEYLKLHKSFAESRPNIFSVYIDDIFRSAQVGTQISKKLGTGFKVVGWEESNRPIFAALSLESKVTLAIISLIIFVAALNITTTLALVVREHKTEIGVLRTLGTTTRQLASVFFIQGMMLSILGIVHGIAFGLLGCFLGNAFKIVRLSGEIYSLSNVPFRPDPYGILIIASLTFLLSVCAALYPAFKASRIKPMENLRGF